jgi:predicted RNA-binding protein with EMAP domain
MKKKKMLTSFSILPEEILQELFSYLPPKDLLNSSNVSKELQKIIQNNFSSKEFFVSMLEKFNLFPPFLEVGTNSKYYSSLSSFYRFIFHPMETTRTSTLKLKEMTPKKFVISDNFNFERLNKILTRNLIEVPPSIQMFYSLCKDWGDFRQDFFIEGNSICKEYKFFSKNCNCETIFKDASKIPRKYIGIGKIEKFGFKGSFFLCLDNGENFGKIMGKIGDDGYLGFSNKSFHQMIQKVSEFKNFEFNYIELHDFVNSLNFEYSKGPKIFGVLDSGTCSEEEQSEEFSESENEIESDEDGESV